MGRFSVLSQYRYSKFDLGTATANARKVTEAQRSRTCIQSGNDSQAMQGTRGIA